MVWGKAIGVFMWTFIFWRAYEDRGVAFVSLLLPPSELRAILTLSQGFQLPHEGASAALAVSLFTWFEQRTAHPPHDHHHGHDEHGNDLGHSAQTHPINASRAAP